MNILIKLISYLPVGVLLLLTSCSIESPWNINDRAGGKIKINLLADGGVLSGTRADDMSPLVPNSSEFALLLKSRDGSYKNSWNSLEVFNKESGFPMGSYSISASYGDPNSEGFTHPYFYGESNVDVTIGKTSEVTILATLSNAMVSLRYTDQFHQFFSSYSGIVQTEGHDPLIFVQGESRPAYISTGNVELKLTLTKNEGQTITVNPASFVAEARKHYIITFGVEGNVEVGEAILTVEWSEELVEETKEIVLTDELFTTPLPEINGKGYNYSGNSVFEGVNYDDLNPEFHIIAFGGIANAILRVMSEDGMVPAGFSSLSLVGADTSTQASLISSGIDCAGFFGKTAEMALINFKEFVRNLTPGTYRISLDVEDSLGRTVSLDIDSSLKITVEGIKYEFSGFFKPDFMSEEIVVMVSTNCEDAKQQFKFQTASIDSNFIEVSSEYLRDNDSPTISTDLPFTFTYKLSGNQIKDWKWKVRTQLSSKTAREMTIDVNMPELNIECDPFANRVRIKVTGEKEDIAKWIIEQGSFYKNDEKLNNEVSLTDDIFEINGLEPGLTYSDYSVSLGKGLYPGYKNNINFQTEYELDVPNGEFNEEDAENAININPINVGGNYWVSVLGVRSDQQIKSSIERIVPLGWATLNDLTCYSSSENKNTWYMVPSTFMENNQVIIRSVGYNHAGPTIPESGKSFNRNYYCENKPDLSDLFKSAGELFLGSYDYDNLPQRIDGIEFKSRPSSLNFKYSYSAVDGETGLVTIKIMDKDGNVLSENERDLTESIGNVDVSVPLVNYPFGKPASKIEVSFKSTKGNGDPTIIIPTDLDEGFTASTYLANRQKAANDYKAFAKGSELKISNVHLGY